MQEIKRVLVLGGTGYIGSYLCGYLKEAGLEVYKAGRSVSGTGGPEYIRVDLSDIRQVKEVLEQGSFDCVINAAGYVFIPKEGEAEMGSELFEGNVNAAANLMEAIRWSCQGNTRLLHLSTMAVYGQAQYLPVDEGHPQNPVNLYGVSKSAGEQVIRYYARKYGIPSLLLRVPGVFGGDRKGGAVYHFIRNALQNKDIHIQTRGLKSWSAIYIDTLADIILRLIRKYPWAEPCKAVNVSYEENIDIIETAGLIKDILKSGSAVCVEQPVDYKEFYMENKELCGITGRVYSFREDLDRYAALVKAGETL